LSAENLPKERMYIVSRF